MHNAIIALCIYSAMGSPSATRVVREGGTEPGIWIYKNAKEPNATAWYAMQQAANSLAGTLTFSAHAGVNTVHFDGLVSAHKKLEPGIYTLLVTATASGKQPTPSSLHFTIANR